MTSLEAAAFEKAINFIIDRLEGGAAQVIDQGGLTKYGISKKAYPELDIASLTREQAIEIYAVDYWNKPNLRLLPAPLAFIVFDTGINMGPKQAAAMLQDMLRVKRDGEIGPKTAEAAHAFLPAYELRAEYLQFRLRFYEDLAKKYPRHLPSLYGWRMRCFRVADEAGRWAGEGIVLA